MKECSRCHQLKPLDNFPRSHSNRVSKDGHRAMCKSCDNASRRTPHRRQWEKDRYNRLREDPKFRAKQAERAHAFYSRHKNLPEFRENQRRLAAKIRRTQNHKDSQKRYRDSNPEKRYAQGVLYRAIGSGKIERPAFCSICGKPCKPHGHHPDYSKPLEVVWCCALCHSSITQGVAQP